MNIDLFRENPELRDLFLKGKNDYLEYLQMLSQKFNPIIYTEQEFAMALLEYLYTDEEVINLTNEFNKIKNHTYKLGRNETLLFGVLKEVHTDTIKFMFGLIGGLND